MSNNSKQVRQFKGRPRFFLCVTLALMSFIPIASGFSAIAKDSNPATRVNNTIMVKGSVIDSDGEPIIGATVMVKGSSTGTMTDISGEFSIPLAPATCQLVISFIGYETQTVNVTPAKRDIVVRLIAGSQTLDEVVVVGYGTVKRRDLVGAVDQVDSKVLNERANTSVTRSLQGEIPNLNITMVDGKPTHNGSIDVRGTGSIGSGGSALVLIDGVEGSMSTINPQDVASVTVLKDASSAAIYGARGAFGVILITTKNAQQGEATVNYSGSFSMRERTVVPKLVTNGYQWATGYIEAWDNYYNGQNPYNTTINNMMPFSLSWYNELAKRDADSSLEKVRINSDGLYEYFGNTDWDSVWYKDRNYSTEHNVTVSGGTKTANYYISGRYYYQDGIYNVGNERYKQYNVRAKGNLQVKPWLRIGNNMDFYTVDYHQPMLYYNSQLPQRMMEHTCQPLSPVTNPDGTWTYAAVLSGYAGFAEGTSYSQENTFSLNDKFNFELDIVKDILMLSGDFSYLYKRYNRDRVTNMYTAYTGPETTITVNQSSGSTLQNYRQDTDYWAGNLYGQFTPKLGRGNSLTLLAGWNVESKKYRTQTIKREGITIASKPSFSLMNGVTDDPSAGGYDWSYAGAFFRASYNYKYRYLAEVAGRYDGSSKFPENSKWGFFPSASLGWRINEEAFMEGSKGWLDNLKLRLSVGSMGNGNIDPYQYIDYMSISTSSVIIGDSYGSYTSSPGAIPLSLTWEKSTTYDIGLDIDVLNSRLGFGGDIYRRYTTDMYTTGVSLPSVFGTSAPKGNNASLRTDGWELTLTWRDTFHLFSKPFSYSIKAMLWDASSKVTKYINSTGSLSDYYEGMKIGEIWGYHIEGLFRDQEDIDSHATQTFLQSMDKVSRPGMLKFADLNQDGVVDRGSYTINDPGDLTIIGNTTPRYRYGINLGANWNGIGLSVFFQGVGKRDWYPRYDSGYFWGQYNRPFGYMLQAHTGNNVYREDLDNWDTAYWPRYTTYQAHTNSTNRTFVTPNDRFLQNAAYLRLKSLTIDYTFSEKACKNMRIKGLKVWLSGENLLTWTPLHKYAENYDPEVINSGDSDFRTAEGDGYSYPMQKIFTVGLNFSF